MSVSAMLVAAISIGRLAIGLFLICGSPDCFGYHFVSPSRKKFRDSSMLCSMLCSGGGHEDRPNRLLTVVRCRRRNHITIREALIDAAERLAVDFGVRIDEEIQRFSPLLRVETQ